MDTTMSRREESERYKILIRWKCFFFFLLNFKGGDIF